MSIKKKLNLVPAFIIVGLAVVFYFAFMTDSSILNINRAPEVRRINGFPTTAYTEDDVEKVRKIITSEEELSQFLNEVDDSGYLIMREEIDFDKELLLAVTTSTSEFEDKKIKIRKLYEDKDENTLLVSIRETELGESCEKIENKNVGLDIVAISHTTRKIKFERVKEVQECDL